MGGRYAANRDFKRMWCWEYSFALLDWKKFTDSLSDNLSRLPTL